MAYWLTALHDLPAGPRITGSRSPLERGPGECLPRIALTDALPPGDWQALRDRAADLGITPTSLVLTVFADALRTVGADVPFSMLVTTSDRVRLPPQTDNLVRPFTSSMILVLDEALQ